MARLLAYLQVGFLMVSAQVSFDTSNAKLFQILMLENLIQ
jgi:hypothetical protein